MLASQRTEIDAARVYSVPGETGTDVERGSQVMDYEVIKYASTLTTAIPCGKMRYCPMWDDPAFIVMVVCAVLIVILVLGPLVQRGFKDYGSRKD